MNQKNKSIVDIEIEEFEKNIEEIVERVNLHEDCACNICKSFKRGTKRLIEKLLESSIEKNMREWYKEGWSVGYDSCLLEHDDDIDLEHQRVVEMIEGMFKSKDDNGDDWCSCGNLYLEDACHMCGFTTRQLYNKALLDLKYKLKEKI